MQTDTAEKFRTMIPYPCCPKHKAGVEPDAHGKATHPCPKCGKFVEFDYDKLTARVVLPTRGASHRYVKNCNR